MIKIQSITYDTTIRLEMCLAPDARLVAVREIMFKSEKKAQSGRYSRDQCRAIRYCSQFLSNERYKENEGVFIEDEGAGCICPCFLRNGGLICPAFDTFAKLRFDDQNVAAFPPLVVRGMLKLGVRQLAAQLEELEAKPSGTTR